MASSIPKEAKNDLMARWLPAVETTWKVALFTTNQCMTQSLYSSCTGEVAASAWYSTGGATLAGRVASYSGETVLLDATDTQWTTATTTCAYAVVYDTTTSKIRARFELGSQTVAGGTFTIQWNASGLIQLT